MTSKTSSLLPSPQAYEVERECYPDDLYPCRRRQYAAAKRECPASADMRCHKEQCDGALRALPQVRPFLSSRNLKPFLFVRVHELSNK